MTARKTLDDWLRWQEGLHLSAVDMGLARVEKVRQAMDLAPNCPVIMVAGTNGKGSTCAMLSSIFRAAGFKVGTYTSPHILRYNERIAINLQPAQRRAHRRQLRGDRRRPRRDFADVFRIRHAGGGA